MPERILITGATGLVGRALVEALHNRGDEVLIISTDTRSAAKEFPGIKIITGWNEVLSLKNEKIDAIIHLAGMNLGAKRWNDEVKKEIYDSRIDTARKLIDLISQMPVKPKVFITASGVDYYGDRGSQDVYEDSPPADNFIGNLVRDWENEALKAEKSGLRTAAIRTGVVIAKNAPAVKKLALPMKLFIGGPIGSGRQYVSWIHLDDLVDIYLFVLDNDKIKGAVNGTAPRPITMKEFSRQLGRALHRPSLFPVPSFIVKIIAGEMADLVLCGRKALPKKITEAGYIFKYTDVYEALKTAV